MQKHQPLRLRDLESNLAIVPRILDNVAKISCFEENVHLY